MAKDFLFYKEELPPSHDRYHAVIKGNLFLFFEKNKAEILPGHAVIIRSKVVRYMINAVRAMGQGEYNLSVLGMASSTGPRAFNEDLAGKRAYNSAMTAIRMFEAEAKSDPTLDKTTINPNTVQIADDLAKIDAGLLHLRKDQVESHQGFFRSAVFRLTAGKLENHIDHPPSWIVSGPEARRRARELLNTPQPEMAPFPTPWGALVVRKGDIWGKSKRLIVSTGWDHIVYLQEDTLWSVPTADFAREVLLDGIIEGMLAAKPLVRVTHIVMGFIQGLLVGPLEAIAGKIIVLVMWGGAHPKLVEDAYDAAPQAFRALKYINDRCPVLWSVLIAKIGQVAGQEIVNALKETVTNPENIAFCLGRILRGVGGVDKMLLGKASPGKAMIEITMGRILFVTIECALLVTALHLPGGFLTVAKETVGQLAKDVQEKFKSDSRIAILLDDAQANLIALELLQPGAKQELEKMKDPLEKLNKFLEKLQTDLDSEN